VNPHRTGTALQISGCGSRTYKRGKTPPLPPFASCYDKLAAAAPLTDRARKEAPCSPSKPARVDGVSQRQARRPGGLDRAVSWIASRSPFRARDTTSGCGRSMSACKTREKDRERHRVLLEGRPGGSVQTLSGRNLNDHDGSEPPRYGPICPAAWEDRRRPGVCSLRLAP
jgi:hypothetical protein